MEAGLKPAAPNADVSKVDITNVKLSEPPSYELGQLVSNNWRLKEDKLDRLTLLSGRRTGVNC